MVHELPPVEITAKLICCGVTCQLTVLNTAEAVEDDVT
jgi:hypothetical protein